MTTSLTRSRDVQNIRPKIDRYVPVRRGNGPLHISQATGKGYTTACGITLAGANLEVPMPKKWRSRDDLDTYWARCWQLERACLRCEKCNP